MQPAPVFTTSTTQPPGAMSARRFSARHVLFKVGVGVLVFSFVLFLVSFVAPYWVEEVGLWTDCSGGDCKTYRTTADWFNAVRAMEVLALVAFLASLGMELYQDVLKRPPPPDNKVVEILAFIAMAFHLIGIIVFGVHEIHRLRINYNSPWSYNDPFYGTKRLDFSWAYGLAIAACVFGVVGASLIALSRARHGAVGYPQQQQLPTTGMMTPMQAMPTGYGYPASQPYYTNGVATTPSSGQCVQFPPGQPSSGFLAAGGPLPAYYIETQGRPIPVYRDVSSCGPAVGACPQLQPAPAPAPAPALAPAAVAEPTADQQRAAVNGEAPDASDTAPVKL